MILHRTKPIRYRMLGPLFALADDAFLQLPFTIPKTIRIRNAELSRSGMGIAKRDFIWDGASFPFLHDMRARRCTIAAGLWHDHAYRLERAGLLPTIPRSFWDEMFRQILDEDGMTTAEADLWFAGVRIGGASSAAEQQEAWEVVHEAP